jgi:RNA polymerase sigma-70 factor (ECF subfamily)
MTQDVFVAAFEGLRRFELRAGLATWLLRIAIFVHNRRLRQAKRLPTLFLPDHESGAPQPAETADPSQASIAQIAFGQALDALPGNQKAAFVLVRMEGLTHREAADVLEAPIGTVLSWVRKATQTMRREFGEPSGATNHGVTRKPTLVES